jgi:23S rRNA pseudouridine1911/1915/1917 synthase
VGGPRRPGIVHRLDKDTSGLLVLAKTPAAYDSLIRQLAARTVKRRYVAVVHGRVRTVSGVVDAPIGRDPHHRQRMAVATPGKGKRAVTRWGVMERFPHFTRLDVNLETGRTHQIRVHMASLGHPVVGDRTYGAKLRPPVSLEGMALHAAALSFVHPRTQAMYEFTASIPARIEALLSHLRNNPDAGSR